MRSRPRMRLLKFGSKTCGPCIGMDKAKTLERFVEKHPEVQVATFDISDEEGESPPKKVGDPKSIDYKANMKLSDVYRVTALPTLVFEVEMFGEMRRIEGASTLKDLEKAYEQAVTSAEGYVERARLLPWANSRQRSGFKT